jgi:urea carboxylase-associated protein 2
MSDTGTPDAAREHARAQARSAAALTAAQPTIPPTAAMNLPPDVPAADVVWAETVPGGGYAARLLERGSRVRLENVEGDACLSVLLFNAVHPAERLNVADTVKVQWQAYLGAGALLLSDMGRVLMSITKDTCGQHDTFCGASTARSKASKYGAGDNHGPYPSARDRFLLALAKHGLSRRDIGPNINLFRGVRVDADGSVRWRGNPPVAGEVVELRAEMPVLLVIANTPHVLDPRATYTVTPVRVLAYRGSITPEDDPIRTSTPERLRAFQNTEYYCAR